MNTTEIQRIISNYYEQLYVNKMDNLEETEKFSERYNLLWAPPGLSAGFLTLLLPPSGGLWRPCSSPSLSPPFPEQLPEVGKGTVDSPGHPQAALPVGIVL